MARPIATNTDVDRDALLDFLRPRHHVVLITTRNDGGLQTSPVSGGVDGQGRLVMSTYPQRAKRWCWSCPRRSSRSWSTTGRSRVSTPTRWGPIATGGFPPGLVDD
jgi:hypothetical protein